MGVSLNVRSDGKYIFKHIFRQPKGTKQCVTFLFSSLCRKKMADNQQEPFSMNAKRMRLQTGWPVWCWFTMMGLEYKCPSLHYHSHKRLIALCLPFYQYSPPSCYMWFWACDSFYLFFIWGTVAVLCQSLQSAWCQCFKVALSDLYWQLPVLERKCLLSNSVLECLHLLWRSQLTL